MVPSPNTFQMRMFVRWMECVESTTGGPVTVGRGGKPQRHHGTIDTASLRMRNARKHVARSGGDKTKVLIRTCRTSATNTHRATNGETAHSQRLRTKQTHTGPHEKEGPRPWDTWKTFAFTVFRESINAQTQVFERSHRRARGRNLTGPTLDSVSRRGRRWRVLRWQ